MKALKDTRSNWIFACPQGLHIVSDDVKSDEGKLFFSKSKFQEAEKCEEWIANADFSQHKTISESITKGLSLTPSDWELIKALLVKQDQFDEDGVVIFEDYLAHNVVDRENERFPKKVLQRFAETLKGKRKLMAHDWSGSAGALGRYYKTRLQKVSVDEAIEMMNYPDPKRARAMFEEIEQEDGGIYWLVGNYYVPKHKSEEILDISYGLFPSSIGTIGLGFEEVKDAKGNFKYWQYVLTPRTEAVEGSLVGVEAQHGAGTLKNAGYRSTASDEPEERELHQGGDEGPIKKTGGKMKVIVKSLGFEHELEALEGAEAMATAIEAKALELTEEKGKLETQVKELTDKVNEVEVDRDGYKAIAEQALEEKVEAVVAAKVLCGLADNKDEVAIDALKTALRKETFEALEERRKEYEAIRDRSTPANGQVERQEKKLGLPGRYFELD